MGKPGLSHGFRERQLDYFSHPLRGLRGASHFLWAPFSIELGLEEIPLEPAVHTELSSCAEVPPQCSSESQTWEFQEELLVK